MTKSAFLLILAIAVFFILFPIPSGRFHFPNLGSL